MEDTLGKRICTNRKRLGLTQDGLAEQLGVTAQAVSKWENDQSCPDITMIPKLAQIFGITTDALLGIESQPPTAEIVTAEETEPEDGLWEMKWDSGRKPTLMLAVWILLTGGMLLIKELGFLGPGSTLDLWDFLWPCGLLTFGIFGLYPSFSVFRLGCVLFGGYLLLDTLCLAPFGFRKTALLPFFLILFGLKLLGDSLKKSKNSTFRISHDGQTIIGETASYCCQKGEGFRCSGSFGDKQHFIQLPRLARGEAKMSFGEMTLDLTGCRELAPGACMEASCSFGELEILVPRQWRVIPDSKTSFAAVNIQGSPDPDANAVLNLNCNVSFGEISVRYV